MSDGQLRHTARALVTGASGFTGRALCRLLADEGVEVFGAGRSAPAVGAFVPLAYPVTDAQLEKVIEEVQPDFVFHLAGVARGQPSRRFYEINAGYAAALLEALKLHGRPCSVLVVGTSAEYGQIRAEDLPIDEGCSPRPYGHYGISKLAQTQLALTYDAPNLRVVVARTFNLIGPGMPSYLAVQAFIDQLVSLRGPQGARTLKVGNLQPSRDYLHVRSAVEAYWKLIRAPAAHGRVVNVCSGMATRVSEIVDQLVEIAGGRVRIEVDPARLKPLDIAEHYGDKRLLGELTGLQPTLDLRAALQEAFLHSSRSAADDHR